MKGFFGVRCDPGISDLVTLLRFAYLRQFKFHIDIQSRGSSYGQKRAVAADGEGAFGFEQSFKRGQTLGSQWGAEVGYTSQVYKLDWNGISESIDNNAIFLSLFYAYRFGLGEAQNLWFEPFIGAFTCFYPSPFDGTYYDNGYHVADPYYSVSIDSGDRSNTGINIGVRFWFNKRISVDFTYRRGFNTKFANYSHAESRGLNNIDYDWRNRDYYEAGLNSFILRIGVKLNK